MVDETISLFFFFLEGLYFQENFIWKTLILKTRTIKSLKEEENRIKQPFATAVS